ncbi:related to RNA polymerase II holoenzyme mediator subunit [Lecanosticta acicola]|uniref:Mediator of RNA polymerase II transcription subunit 21 n=1 Tax=Lecanosticta acicola TaxID=111012 RepID=A0AAI8YS79_9PEZI|nr:related to RNA polymerase II holoenzyme mediator subunit [Lecanosticta acicola]
MADRLTQLQDCLDDLLTQMYSSLNYIYTRHQYGEIPGQPNQAPQPASQEATANGVTPAANGNATNTPAPAQNGTGDAGSPAPDPPDTFNAAMHELAQDLVLKEQQIELIIRSLPGIGNSEAEQEKRMRELEAELRQVEKERVQKEAEKEAMVDLLGQVIGEVKRVP